MTKVKLIKVLKGGRKRGYLDFQWNREDYLVRTILFNLYCFMAKRITVKFGWWWLYHKIFGIHCGFKAHIIRVVGNYFE
jgi:hypothetical protein